MNQDIIIYDSKKGHSKTIAESVGIPCVNVNCYPDLKLYRKVIFVCPTYGDEELPEEMEKFIVNLKVTNKKFTICELGNYYGYDDPEFGAAKIIRYHLFKLQWQEFMKQLSLDSLPKINWSIFNQWKTELLHKCQSVQS
jgi:flavodoxin